MTAARTVVRNSLLLAGFAALTAGLIAGTWRATAPDIARAEQAAEARQLLELFPAADSVEALLAGKFTVPANTALLELHQDRAGYRVIQRAASSDGDARGLDNDDVRRVTGVILPATARDGYSGDIRLLVGIHADGRVAGVRAVGHRETPGLGDKIELKKSDWILDFNGRALGDPAFKQWTVRKDGGVFDQFTGATVTPRAVVTAVRRTLEYVQNHHADLFAVPETNASATPPAGEEDAAS
jgi:electron transport complex protein RnfG